MSIQELSWKVVQVHMCEDWLIKVRVWRRRKCQLMYLARLCAEHFTYISSFNYPNNQVKLKTITCFKVEVLERRRINDFVKDSTASVNRMRSHLLSEAQTMPFLPHHTKHYVRITEGAGLKADMLWITVQ